LSKTLAGKMNLARIKLFGMFICALCKVQTVCFEKLSTAFETEAKSGSSLRRIQRFMAEYTITFTKLNDSLFAKYIISPNVLNINTLPQNKLSSTKFT